jgi:hypothetical protein
MAQVRLDDSTRDALRALKEGAETYDDVVTRLINENDSMKFMGGELDE